MSKFIGVEHLFFDLDHTLWDFDRNSKMAYAQIFEELQVALDLDVFIEHYEPLNLIFWRRYRINEITKEQLRYRRLKEAFDACDFHVSDSDIDRMSNMYLEYLPMHNHLFAGCLEVLDSLSNHFQLHIITNGFDEVQDKKLHNSGLKPYFKYMLTAETAKTKKPDIAIFQRALKETGALVSNSVMIGDSYEADILGARNAGLRTIWFHTTQEKIPVSESVVHHLKDLYPLLVS